LDQNDPSGAKQHFIWAKEKVSEAKRKLEEVSPRENEKESYDSIGGMLEEYDKGLDMIIEGIGNNDTAQIENGIASIAQSIKDLTKAGK